MTLNTISKHCLIDSINNWLIMNWMRNPANAKENRQFFIQTKWKSTNCLQVLRLIVGWFSFIGKNEIRKTTQRISKRNGLKRLLCDRLNVLVAVLYFFFCFVILFLSQFGALDFRGCGRLCTAIAIICNRRTIYECPQMCGDASIICAWQTQHFWQNDRGMCWLWFEKSLFLHNLWPKIIVHFKRHSPDRRNELECIFALGFSISVLCVCCFVRYENIKLAGIRFLCEEKKKK